MNENMMDFQYIEDLDIEYLNVSFELKKKTILSLNEDNAKKSSSSKDKV